MKFKFLTLLAVFCLGIFVSATDSSAQRWKRAEIQPYESEISFKGDTKFLRRFYRVEDDEKYVEQLKIEYGTIIYERLPRGKSFRVFDEAESLARAFSSAKGMVVMEMRAAPGHVIKTRSPYGEYYYEVRGNKFGVCGNAKMYFKPGEFSTSATIKTHSVFVGACWENRIGTQGEMRNYLLDLMNNIRFKS